MKLLVVECYDALRGSNVKMVRQVLVDDMQLLATMLDTVEGGKLPVVLLDAEGRTDIAVLLANPLFGMSAKPAAEWVLRPGGLIELRVEVRAYSVITFSTCFAWPEYREWLSEVAAANALKLVPVVRPEQLEASLLDDGAPGIIIRNFAGQLWSILSQLSAKKGLF